MIYTTGTIAISGNAVTGTGTNFSAPLSLIRVGCTLIAVGNPVQIFTITEIKSGTELSVTPAANPAISAGTKFSILLSDSISVDGLAQDVAETLRFYQEKEDEISSAIDGSNIGLGPEPRDCTDISGNPSSYVGFLRIKETANGFPTVAAGESSLSGFICQRDGTPSYTGVFVGWATRSLYSYTWVASSGANWTSHARLDGNGNLTLTSGDFVGRSARLTSNVNTPLILQSAHPTIRFIEEDRSEGAPDYAFIFDGGNWRIEKNHWETPPGRNCIGYNFTTDEIEVPNLKVSNANSKLKRTFIYDSDFGRRLSIETKNTAATNSEMLFWGSDARRSVLEYSFTDPDNGGSLGYGFFCQLNTDNTVKFQVNGVVNCTTLNQSSDRDLKDNIQVISNATEAIRKMNGYTYTLKENGLPYAGIIAQEAMEAIPEAVGSFTHYGEALQGPTIDGNELREETRYLNVDYAAVTGLLVQVARETDNRVTELEEENASLRANIAVMDERITKLEALVRQLTGSEK